VRKKADHEEDRLDIDWSGLLINEVAESTQDMGE